MPRFEIGIPYELIDAAWEHPDVRKHTDLLAQRVADSVNRRLQSEGINLEYRVSSGRRTGAKPRPFANVHPVSTGDNAPRDWNVARKYLQVAIQEQAKGKG